MKLSLYGEYLKANVLIVKADYGYAVKVEGRANIECSPPLKNFGENIIPGTITKITFDMSECSWMDSTFMGTLAMLGLKAKKAGISIEMLNMDQKNRNLISDLGIDGLFKFENIFNSSNSSANWTNITSSQPSPQSTAETILAAHETLVQVDDSNAQKFGKVIEMVKKDLAEAISH